MTYVTYTVLAAPSNGRGGSKFSILCPGGELRGVMYSPDVKLAVDHVSGNIVLNDVEYRIDRNPPQSVEWARPDSGDDLFWLQAPLTEVLDGHTLRIRVRTLDRGLIDDEPGCWTQPQNVSGGLQTLTARGSLNPRSPARLDSQTYRK
jgi:hypothetical protein